MKSLKQLKNDYAIDLGYMSWKYMLSHFVETKQAALLNLHFNEIMKIYAMECLKLASVNGITNKKKYYKMKNLMGYSVLVDNEEQAEKLQEIAISQGFGWKYGDEKIKNLDERSFQFGYGGEKIITISMSRMHYQDKHITKKAHFNELFNKGEQLRAEVERLEKMKVKIKRLSDKAVIPTYAKEGDAGLDLVATSAKYCEKTSSVTYGTDLAIEIPKGYVGLLFARSSNSKKDLLPSNAVGVIDSGYRGEIKFNFKNAINSVKLMARTIKISSETFEPKNTEDVKEFLEDYIKEFTPLDAYQVGDRIGQLIIMPYPQIEFEEVNELSTTERGIGGYGSTGN